MKKGFRKLSTGEKCRIIGSKIITKVHSLKSTVVKDFGDSVSVRYANKIFKLPRRYVIAENNKADEINN